MERPQLNSPYNKEWLDTEASRLTSFARKSRHPVTGFADLDSKGRPQLDKPLKALTTTRMTHVFSLAHLCGEEGADEMIDHGINTLRGPLHDDKNGGWFAELTPNGEPRSTRKTAYEHAFVVLAASSATVAARPYASELLDDALTVVEKKFWRDEEDCSLESWNRDWTETENYRGANSNMHLVEAFIAAGDVTGESKWHERALRISDNLINQAARDNGWRLPEHFDTNWQPIHEYNEAEKAHPFRPYGTTIGHWLEWSRLMLHLEASLPKPPKWLSEDAKTLFDSATEHGWAADGKDGFVYTLDWNDRPSVRNRMHWVVAEGIGAAAALHQRTGEQKYEVWYNKLWDHAETHFIDRTDGNWHHELDENNQPATTVWSGKNDIYHALQATLVPQLPLAPTMSVALKERTINE